MSCHFEGLNTNFTKKLLQFLKCNHFCNLHNLFCSNSSCLPLFSFSLPDPERTHFMWGFSKDFGMSGIRVGVLYTRNNEIRKAVNQLAVFHSCPGPVQHVLSQFLRDRDWLDNVFFPTNKKRLKEAQNILVDGLADVGIPVLKSSGGLYVWADFRKVFRDLSKCCTVTLLNQSQTTHLLLQMLYAIQKKILQANLQTHEEKMSPS
uniref:Aminotransferase class I/classII large domain-containing protein n=1 Tax=Accipiter nisus TaxID=211598 RepID=A0A8B9NAG4_9AVES